MDELKDSLGKAERIGVIGSPSSTANLTIDILATAVDKRLVGNLSVFSYIQNGNDHYALGQIVEIEMRNVWAQDPTMRGLIRHKGRVDPITERQDTHTASMTVSSVFVKKGGNVEQSIFGTVPSTGTPIKLLSEDIMNSLLVSQQDELFYLGNAYGTNIPLPMWFKHFDKGNRGAGEAYHIGVFGKTGSGKSVLAKMILTAYCRHPELSIIIMDPQGEYSRDYRRDDKFKELIKKTGKQVEIYNVQNIALTGWPLFRKILVNSGFLNRLGIILDTNRMQAAFQIEKILKESSSEKDKNKVLWKIHNEALFKIVWKRLQDEDVIRHIYSGKEYQERVLTTMQYANEKEKYQEWKKIANLFSFEALPNRTTIRRLIDRLDKGRSLMIIDLSREELIEDLFWDETIKFIVIGQFLEAIGKKAESGFKDEKVFNGLVIIDEAHRLAPRERLENEDLDNVRNYLVDAIRTTRKYGLGWMFISQTLSSLHRDIINQIRIYLFGFGLG